MTTVDGVQPIGHAGGAMAGVGASRLGPPAAARLTTIPTVRHDGAGQSEPPVGSITVLVPIRDEAGNLPELHRRLAIVLAAVDLPYELLFVDDGSTDGSWAIIRDLHASDPRVKGLRHRRNFGKAQALAAGFAVARGDVVVTMDGDLQDDPDELPRFLVKLGDGYDLVSGWKQRRQDPLGKTLPSRVFNLTVRRVSGVPLHDFNCGYKAYRREVVRALRIYGELHRFTPVLAHAEGFRIGELPVRHHPRRWGQSKYGWSRLVKGFLDLLTVTFLTQYRQRPMHLFGLPGLVAIVVGLLLGVYLSGVKLLGGEDIGGRPLLLLAVLLLVVGAQFFGLGLLGEFLAHGSNATREDLRPLVRETLGVDDAPPAGVTGDATGQPAADSVLAHDR